MTASSNEASWPLYQGVGFVRASRCVLVVLLGLLVIPSLTDGTNASPAGVIGLAMLVAPVAAVWELRLRRLGIRISPEGVVATYAIMRRRFPLSDVVGFSLRYHGSSGGTRCVFIELVNGKRRVVPSVCICDWGPFKSNEIRWSGGKTDDVLGELTRQLARVRLQGQPIAN